jgi:CHAT domain-containing protein
LDLVDVRSADLSRCQLVVLSSCGSGASYLSGRLSAPSLAEAFLQAGARAVISTSWSVADDDGSRVMHAFAEKYASSKDPISALGEARRQLIKDEAPPHVWAAYSILVAGL